jgi:hypothetical protein
MSALHIGIDIDNTIIDYDGIFGPVGEEIGLLPAGHGLRGKTDVKSFLLAQSKDESDWMRLQGQIYGRYIGRAALYDGVSGFLRMARRGGARVSLVSHKTRYGHFDAGRVDLWEAAMGWLESRAFFEDDGFGLARADVHFRETREAKIATIGQIGCAVFIDDLPEVLQHEDFPANVQRIWFGSGAGGAGDLVPHADWTQIAAAVAPLLHNNDAVSGRP